MALDSEGRAEKQLLYVSKSLVKVGSQNKSWTKQKDDAVISHLSWGYKFNQLADAGETLEGWCGLCHIPTSPFIPRRDWWVGTPWPAADSASGWVLLHPSFASA